MRSAIALRFCVILIFAPALLQGCAATAVADAAVGTTFFVAKTAVKGTVGAGKLVYRGGKAVGNAVVGGGNNDVPYTGGPADQTGPSCLMVDGSYEPAMIDANGLYYCPS